MKISMEDLGAFISSFLGNPENVEKLKAVLDSFSKSPPKPEPEAEAAPVPVQPVEPSAEKTDIQSAAGPKGISPETLKTALAKLPMGEDDNRTLLLKALRPYLSQKRAGYADTAMGLLSVSKIIGSLGEKK